ncbi:MAG: TIGR00282 family metallophosphoesterase [Bradyrhizobiaceae bacterium]|nr:TIGR00282 family metallophosphoesterase [Bradyrhizobiaceae bacterium]
MRLFNLLFIGDVVGNVGLRELLRQLPELISTYSADAVVVNGENIVNGKGLTEAEANALFAAGVHCITTGNHVWDNWKSRSLLASTPNVLRPFNYPSANPGRGWCLVELPGGRTIGVIQVQGRVFMQPIDDPFKAVDDAILQLKPRTSMIMVDFHADATAEAVAMGWHLDGRVSAVLGTHTHIQTADATILPNGTAYVTDVGMSGPYDSVIGMQKDVALKRMQLQTAHKYEVAEADVRICGAHVIIDEVSGDALQITTFQSPPPRTSIVQGS